MTLPVRANITGTMADRFRIGKSGPTILQGSSAPAIGDGSVGDLFILLGTPPSLLIKDTTGWRSVSDVSVRSDVRVVTNPATTTYSFLVGGSPMSVSGSALVYLNRALLRPGEYTISSNQVTFVVALSEDDELEVISGLP
jgi:hypothetical protein